MNARSSLMALLAMLGNLIALPALATCPFFDRISVDGQWLTIRNPTSFPRSAEDAAWLRTLRRCSAAHQGRALYRVAGDTVYLTGFAACFNNRPLPQLSELYPGAGDRIVAEWLSGPITAFGGREICASHWCPVYDTQSVLQVDKGKLVGITTAPNPNITVCDEGKTRE